MYRRNIEFFQLLFRYRPCVKKKITVICNDHELDFADFDDDHQALKIEKETLATYEAFKKSKEMADVLKRMSTKLGKDIDFDDAHRLYLAGI